MHRCVSLLLLVSVAAEVGVAAQGTLARTQSVSAASDGSPRLTGAVVELPLLLIKGYPFIDGEIAGHRGKLMFDLGATPALTINSHAVPIPGGVADGTGHFGSGQQTTKTRYLSIDAGIRIGALRYGSLRNVEGRDGTVIEHDIAPDFIGWIGLRYFTGYVARIDDARRRVTFFRDGADRTGLSSATAGRKILGTIALTNPIDHPNLRFFEANVGATRVTVGIDTGFPATAYARDARIAAWRASGLLRARPDGRQMISSIEAGGVALRLSPVNIERGKPPFAAFLPRKDEPVIMMGYEFFKQYVVTLDYQRDSLKLQRP